MIAGGYVYSTYILEVQLLPTSKEVCGVDFKPSPNLPQSFQFGFSKFCKGRTIQGCDYNKGKSLSNVFKLDMDWYPPMTFLNETRKRSGVYYLSDSLIVSERWGNGRRIESIEKLEIRAELSGSEFCLMNTRLPCPVERHTLSPFKEKLVLIESYDDL